MDVLVDTNVWLDVICDRQPFCGPSAEALTLLEEPEHTVYLCATTVTTLYYLVAKHSTASHAKAAVKRILQRHRVAPVDSDVLASALDLSRPDFEDAVLEAAALKAGLDAIVTRNVRDFERSELLVFTPSQLVAALA